MVSTYSVKRNKSGVLVPARTVLAISPEPRRYYLDLCYTEDKNTVYLLDPFKYIFNGYMYTIPENYTVQTEKYVGFVGRKAFKDSMIRSIFIFAYSKDVLMYEPDHLVNLVNITLKNEGFGWLARQVASYSFIYW